MGGGGPKKPNPTNTVVGQPKEADPQLESIHDGQPIEACPESNVNNASADGRLEEVKPKDKNSSNEVK